jgi:hypothetical protein
MADSFADRHSRSAELSVRTQRHYPAYQGCVYFPSVPLTAAKTLAGVQLPNVSAAAVAGTATLHVFSLVVH